MTQLTNLDRRLRRRGQRFLRLSCLLFLIWALSQLVFAILTYYSVLTEQAANTALTGILAAGLVLVALGVPWCLYPYRQTLNDGPPAEQPERLGYLDILGALVLAWLTYLESPEEWTWWARALAAVAVTAFTFKVAQYAAAAVHFELVVRDRWVAAASNSPAPNGIRHRVADYAARTWTAGASVWAVSAFAEFQERGLFGNSVWKSSLAFLFVFCSVPAVVAGRWLIEHMPSSWERFK